MPLDPVTGLQTVDQDPPTAPSTPTSTSAQAQLDGLTKQLDDLQAAANAPLNPDGSLTEAGFMAQQQLPKIIAEWRQMRALVDKETANPKTGPLKIFTAADGSTYSLDAQGNKTQLTGPKVPPDKPFTIPDPITGLPIAATWQEYQAYATAKNRVDANQNAQDRTSLTAQRDANNNANTIARLQQANDLANARTDLGYYQADLQNKIDQGKLSEQQAMDLFKQKVDMLTYEQTQQQNAFTRQQTAFTDQATMQQAGLAAGNQAMEAARLGTVNAVGPDFGKNYAASLTAASQGNPSAVHFGAGDFTMPMPNYAQLAQQGAAAAIAHLSPYAASVVGQPGMQPYQGMTATTAPVAGAPLAGVPANYVAPNLEGSANSTQRMAPLQPVPVPSYRPPMGAATR